MEENEDLEQDKDQIENEEKTEKVESHEEADLPGLMPIVDHGHGHHRSTGLPWLDIVVGVSVVFISVLSLIVSIEHGRTMEKMVEQNQKLVAANTLPLLTYGGSNLDEKTLKPRLHYALTNGGVGPAIIDKFVLSYKGVNYHHPTPLLMACCSELFKTEADKDLFGHDVTYANITGTILTPHESVNVISVPMNEKDARLFNAFYKVGDEIQVSACYCSVLNECWETHFDNKRPQPVASCTTSPQEVLW